MRTESLRCPNCGAALHVGLKDSVVVCPYCHSSIRVTANGSGESILTVDSSQETALSPEMLEEVKQLLREGQRIEAIKLYREQTEQSLQESKNAVDAIGERMGIVPSGAGTSKRSCVGIVVGFLLWVVIIGLASVGLGKAARSMFGESSSAAVVNMIQVLGTFVLVIVSIAGFIVWANVSRKKGKG